MELSLIFDADNNVVRARLAGPFSLFDAKTSFTGILDALVQHQAKKALIDGSAVTGRLETMDRFDYGEFVAASVNDLHKRGFFLHPEFAYVLSDSVLDSSRFGETVAVNRGMRVRAFNNLSEAEEWLQIMSSSVTPI